jgi:hypothetical protein
MQKSVLAIATLLITACPFAVAKDLPRAGIAPLSPLNEEQRVTSATLEIVDQNKSIKLACETFQFDIRAPTTSGDTLESTVSCFTTVDANTPLLWEYVNKKQRLEKAVLSVNPGKGPSYVLEVPNVMIVNIGFTDNWASKVSINLAAASSRLTVQPAPQ